MCVRIILVVDRLLQFIERVFNVKHGYKPLKNHWVTHWNDDSFAFGFYSYHPKGSSLEDNSEIAKPIGRLIFAGEHIPIVHLQICRRHIYLV